MTDEPQLDAFTEACEVLKVSYRQERDGMYITVCVQPDEMPQGLATAPLNSRWMSVWVRLGDDEKPVPKPVAAEKRKQAQNSNVMRAAMLCNEPLFHRFLSRKYGKQWRGALGTGAGQAADAMRAILGIDSRRDIGSDPDALAGFDRLHAEFETWKST